MAWLENREFDLFEELKHASVAFLRRMLDTADLSDEDVEQIKRAVIHQIITASANNDRDYRLRIGDLKALILRVDGSLDHFQSASPEVIREVLANPALSTDELKQVKGMIEQQITMTNSNDDERFRRRIDMLKSLLADVEDRIHFPI